MINIKKSLSIVMANYNYGQYIPDAINAILNQSRLPDEFIIIDDASTDNSVEIILNQIKNFPFVKLIQHKKNTGVIDLINEGIHIAKGDYLYLAASDDFISPEFIEKMMDFIDINNNISICTSIPGFFNSNDKSKIYFYPFYEKKECIFTRNESIKVFNSSSFWIPSHATIFKREYALLYNGYNRKLKHYSDWYLNIKIALNHGMAYVPEPIAAMRIHDSSYSAKQNKCLADKMKNFSELLNIVNNESYEFKNAFVKSAVISQLGSEIVLFLILKPKYWNYLFFVLIKKIKNFYKKLTKLEFKKKPMHITLE
jgi:glycosyltransferase involved in cell wall biosynthesis